jgi:hypothetical protein
VCKWMPRVAGSDTKLPTSLPMPAPQVACTFEYENHSFSFVGIQSFWYGLVSFGTGSGADLMGGGFD